MPVILSQGVKIENYIMHLIVKTKEKYFLNDKNAKKNSDSNLSPDGNRSWEYLLIGHGNMC